MRESKHCARKYSFAIISHIFYVSSILRLSYTFNLKVEIVRFVTLQRIVKIYSSYLFCALVLILSLYYFTLYSVHIFIFLFLFSFRNFIFLLSLVSISLVINITLNFRQFQRRFLSARKRDCKISRMKNLKSVLLILYL